ncbi:XRE family transcriptional regulator [Cylindrospermopsis curvispora]|uniref:XRE family transcriptional regulator n=1 Tax=Cylindrospermopsis curvispora GIHE-G1 TaxID=2666332 RepID=A0A7H0F5P7_9CYAN|nr:XRE family transcriptional regulator [Cylindrospermopsis curvispora]QNP31363.1 XRE family transcriptional regulator [Cylindrospermopsis curvispora GIHE-G1]
MAIHEIFKRSMDMYGVRGKDLAVTAGVSAQHVTDFRQGRKWVSEGTLEALLRGMERLSPGSIKYFCDSLVSQKLIEVDYRRQNTNLDNKKMMLANLVKSANIDELESLSVAINKRWKELIKNQENEEDA